MSRLVALATVLLIATIMTVAHAWTFGVHGVAQGAGPCGKICNNRCAVAVGRGMNECMSKCLSQCSAKVATKTGKGRMKSKMR